MTALLQLQGLNAFYGKSHILQGVDFHVQEGEIVSLLGQNLQRLGMTPADRSRVAAPGAPPPKSPWERIDNPSGFDARTN